MYLSLVSYNFTSNKYFMALTAQTSIPYCGNFHIQRQHKAYENAIYRWYTELRSNVVYVEATNPASHNRNSRAD